MSRRGLEAGRGLGVAPANLTRDRGFVLVAVLVVLAFLVMLLVSLGTLTRVENQTSEHAEYARIARQDVLNAVQVALGQLQRYAGPDDRVTATAAGFGGGPGTRHFTGVWDTAETGRQPLTWLVSGTEADSLGVDPASPGAGWVELVGARTAVAQAVVAPEQILPSPTAGTAVARAQSRVAWWVGDVGVKASLALPDRSARVTHDHWAEPALRERLVQQIGSTPTWLGSGTAPDGFDPWAPLNRDRLQNVVFSSQLGALAPAGVFELRSAVREQWPAVTGNAFAVLANTLPRDDPHHGLLRDLSLAPGVLDPAFSAYASLDYVEPPGPGNLALPAITTAASPRRRLIIRGPRTQSGPGEWPIVSTVAPVLTEFLLQFRVDRTEGGVEVRSRLYVGLWNPYTAAFCPPEDLQLRVTGLPKIEITDPLEGAQVRVDLQTAPFGPAGDTVRLPFLAGATPQADRASWLPGRMYSWVTTTGATPSDELQFYSKTLNAAGWVVATVPLAGSSSNLSVAAPATDTLEVELRLDGVLLARCHAPAFPAFTVPDVEPAGPTQYWNWRYAYGFRLNQPSSASLDRSWLVTAGRDPREVEVPPSSYDPFNAAGGLSPDAAVYTGTPATATGFDHLLIYRVQGSGLTTRSANYDAPVFEVPRQSLLSLGELQHLPVAGARPFSLGNPWGGSLNALYDRAFFSGLSAPEEAPDLARDEPLPNWGLRPVRVGPGGSLVSTSELYEAGEYSARHLLQQGAFNINSTEPTAWAAVLMRARFGGDFGFQWADIDNGPTISGTTGSQRDGNAMLASTFHDPDWGANGAAGPTFFRFPQSAQETFFTSDVPALLPTELSRRPFRQGVRGGTADNLQGLPAAQVTQLAARIAELVQVKHASSGPFRSLQEFVNPLPELDGESVIARAIRETEINAPALQPDALVASPDYMGFSSLTLTQADVLTVLAPYLRSRSDTFVIRAGASVANPGTGAVVARAWGEAWVQRFPEPVEAGDSPAQPAGSFGRRFRIVAFRWLSSSEL